MQGRPNIFVPELVYTRRVSLPILERVHKVISNYCFENDYYIENKNIRILFIQRCLLRIRNW